MAVFATLLIMVGYSSVSAGGEAWDWQATYVVLDDGTTVATLDFSSDYWYECAADNGMVQVSQTTNVVTTPGKKRIHRVDTVGQRVELEDLNSFILKRTNWGCDGLRVSVTDLPPPDLPGVADQCAPAPAAGCHFDCHLSGNTPANHANVAVGITVGVNANLTGSCPGQSGTPVLAQCITDPAPDLSCSDFEPGYTKELILTPNCKVNDGIVVVGLCQWIG